MVNELDNIITNRSQLLSFVLYEVWRYCDLLSMYVKRDFITFYKQTIIDPLWFVIQPLFIILFEVVERRFPPIDDPIQSRIYGFMSERLINVFCEHHHLRILFVPLIMHLDYYYDGLNISNFSASYRKFVNDIIY